MPTCESSNDTPTAGPVAQFSWPKTHTKLCVTWSAQHVLCEAAKGAEMLRTLVVSTWQSGRFPRHLLPAGELEEVRPVGSRWCVQTGTPGRRQTPRTDSLQKQQGSDYRTKHLQDIQNQRHCKVLIRLVTFCPVWLAVNLAIIQLRYGGYLKHLVWNKQVLNSKMRIAGRKTAEKSEGREERERRPGVSKGRSKCSTK